MAEQHCMHQLADFLFRREIRLDEINFFEEKKAMFCNSFLESLEAPFLVWFVTYLREIAMENENYDVFVYDPVFITFLDVLTCGSFDKFDEYLSSIYQALHCHWYLPNLERFCLSFHLDDQSKARQSITLLFGDVDKRNNNTQKLRQVHTYHMKCAASIICFYDFWVEAGKDMNNFEFAIPDSWELPTQNAKPYEHYLRSRWPDCFLKMMKLSSEDLTWWSKPLQSSPSVMKFTAVMSKKSTEKKKKRNQMITNALATPITDYKLQASPSLGYDCAWPPTQKHLNIVPTNHSFFSDLKGVDEQLWKFCEELLIPPLASRYHNINSLLPSKNCDSQFMAVGPWFTMWTAAYGPQAFNFLQEEYVRNINLVNSCVKEKEQEKIVKKWLACLTKGTEILQAIKSNKYAPTKDDFAKRIGEFLLNPKILIVLPWNYVSMQQWLNFALIEILKFEMCSMELRHWPLLRECEECARELLSLVAHCKECVLLGLYLCARQIIEVPNTPASLPAALMDQVILPSLSALELLCSGKAYSVLEGIKNVSFSKSHSLNADVILVPDSAYLISDTKLDWFYINHYWHILFWLDDEYKSPMPKVEFAVSSQHNSIIPPKRDSSFLSYNQFSLQEQSFLDMFYGNKWASGVSEMKVGKMLISLDLLLKHLFNLGVVSRDDFKILQSKFQSRESRNAIEEMKFAHLSHLNHIQLAVACSSLFKKVNSRLAGIDSNNSVLSWLVRLSGEVVEKEQLARVSATCAMMLGHTPVHTDVQAAPVSSLEPLLQLVKDSQEQSILRNRGWLWEQLPQEWRVPVLGFKIGITPWQPIPADTLFEIETINNMIKENKALELLKKSVNKTLGPLTENHPNPSLKFKANDLKGSINEAVKSFELRVGQMMAGAAKQNIVAWNCGKEVFHNTIVQYILPCYIASLDSYAEFPATTFNVQKIQRLTTFIHQVLCSFEQSYLCWTRAPNQRDASLEKIKHRLLDTTFLTETNPNIVGRFIFEKIEQYLYAFVNLGQGEDVIGGTFGFRNLGESLLQFRKHEDQSNVLKPHAMENFAYHAWDKVGLKHFDSVLYDCTNAWQLPEAGKTTGPLSKVFKASVVLEVLEFNLQCQGLTDSLEMLISKSCRELAIINPIMVVWRNFLMEMVVQSEGIIECSFSQVEISQFVSEAEDIMYKYWHCIKDIRMTLAKDMKKNSPKIKVDHSEVVKIAVKDFYSGHCDKITETLALNCSAKNRKCELHDMMKNWYIRYEKGIPSSDGKYQQKQKKKKGIPKNLGTLLKKMALQECRCCDKKEMESGTFLACKECIKDKYPDVNYFCSTACKDKWWEKEHMAEHLEFSLGLSNFES